MMKYEALGKTMGRYRCVSIAGVAGAPYDHCLAGKLGEIGPKGDGSYKGFRVQPSGSEKIFSFESNDLHKWIRLLQVPADPNKQLEWANNPNSRFNHVKSR